MATPAGAVVDGRYKIVRLLGEGGYGAVYLAEDARLGNKPIALKESFDKSPEAQEQFRLEAQLLAELSHPGLPRVTDHFLEKDGRQFLVMDYIEGDDLDQRLINNGRPLNEREAVAIILQVCEAVAYLHTRKPQPIIHRDIKPANIKITRQGRAILVDFGIAKVYHPSKRTAKIARAITPYFSSPEQHVAQTDTRSDVYSLGATLYLLLTAELPPESIDRLNQGVNIIPPRQINPQVSPALEKIVLQAMEVLPDKRYLNANRMSASLRAFMSNQPLPVDAARVCPRCGWRNRPAARFCAKDGAHLGGSQVFSQSQPIKPPQQPISGSQALSPEMAFESANAYARNREYLQAIPQYEACLSQGFDRPAVFYNLGICNLEAGRYVEAALALEDGVSRYPDDGDLQYQLARVYLKLNLQEKALTAIERACQLAPDDAINRRMHGEMLLQAKKYSQAARELQKSVSIDASSVRGQILLGRAQGETGRLKSAISTLERATQMAPQSPEPFYWLGYYYRQARKRREARNALNQALRLSPGYQPAQDLLDKL